MLCVEKPSLKGKEKGGHGRSPFAPKGPIRRGLKEGKTMYIPAGLSASAATEYLGLLMKEATPPARKQMKPKGSKRPGDTALAGEARRQVQETAGCHDAMKDMAEQRDEDKREVDELKTALSEATSQVESAQARLVQIEGKVQRRAQKWAERLQVDLSETDWELRWAWLSLATTLLVCFCCLLAGVGMLEILACGALFLGYCAYVVLENWFARWLGTPAFFTKPIYHQYKFLGMWDHEHADRRGDSYSSGEMKHTARYARIEYSRSDAEGVIKPREMLVSLKLVTLVMTARNTDPRLDSVTVWDRMYATASSIHSVNYDADLRLKKTSGFDPKFCEVVTDSVDLAHAIWMQNMDRRRSHFRAIPA